MFPGLWEIDIRKIHSWTLLYYNRCDLIDLQCQPVVVMLARCREEIGSAPMSRVGPMSTRRAALRAHLDVAMRLLPATINLTTKSWKQNGVVLTGLVKGPPDGGSKVGRRSCDSLGDRPSAQYRFELPSSPVCDILSRVFLQ